MKKLTYISLFIASLYISLNSCAQELKKNSFYFELGGNTIAYSLNYDRVIPLNNSLHLVPRVGLMYLPIANLENNRQYANFSIPLEVNLLIIKSPQSKNFIEAGLGLSLIGMKAGGYRETGEYVPATRFARVGTFRAGFRHQKATGGFMYRIGLLAPFSQDAYSESRVGDDIFYRLYGGFSLGHTF